MPFRWTRKPLVNLLAGSGLSLLATVSAQAQPYPQPYRPCPPPVVVQPHCPPVKPPDMTEPTPRPITTPPAVPLDLADAGTGAFAAPGGEASFAPNMFGHLLFGTRSVRFGYLRADGNLNVAAVGATSLVNPSVADNNSPIPRDRVSFRYNHFHNALQVTGISNQVFGATGQQSGINAGQSDDPSTRTVGDAIREFNVNMYTFGFEKTFFDRMLSLELRVPFATSVASKLDFQAGRITSFTGSFDAANPPNAIFNTQFTPQDTLGRESTEFGNLQLIFKGLLTESPCWALAGGVGVLIPTAQDARVRVQDFAGDVVFQQTSIQRFREFRIDNETWALSPYLAAVATPNDRLFAQGFLQFDFPLNDSDVTFTERTNSPGFRGYPGNVIRSRQPGVKLPPFQETTSIEEQILMHVDVGVGYWLARSCNPNRWITGIAPTVELHYTTTLDDADIRTFSTDTARYFARNPRGGLEPPPQVGNQRGNVDILNLTVGNTIEVAQRATVGTGFSFPLRKSESNRTFDWEFQLLLNYYFGGPRTRTPPAF